MQNTILVRAASAALVALGMISSARAAVVWTSHDIAVDASDNTLWSNPLNWGGTAPVAGDAVTIGTPVTNGSRATNNDYPANTQFGNILIKSNLNTITGNAIDLIGNSVQYTAGGSSIGTFTAAVHLNQDTTYSVSANTSNGRLEVGGDISGSFGMIKADAGRLRFTGTAKTYTGNTTITGGLLDLSADNMLPYGAGKGDVYLGTGAQLFLNNVNTNINGLNDYLGAAGTVSKTGSNTRSLTLGNNDANGNFSGAITFTGGSSTVNKTGAGRQVLGGAVSVAGAGVVSGGTLIINSTWTGNVTANTPGTVGGSGSVTGAISGTGKIAPGQSIGTLTAGSVTNTGVLAIELDGTGAGSSDVLNVTGALSITNLSVDFSVLNAVDDPAYVFAKYGSLAGAAFLNATNIPAGYAINYAYNDGLSSNNIALVVVPEPASLALLAGAAMIGLCRRRV